MPPDPARRRRGASLLIPFTNASGLRDWRVHVHGYHATATRWPWLVLVAFLLGLAIGVWR